jgi:hypothetical protein
MVVSTVKPQVDPSPMPETFLLWMMDGLHMTLERRDTKLLARFWVHQNVSTLKG